MISAHIKEDLKKRLEIEGVFGIAKTRYGLAKLMTKLASSPTGKHRTCLFCHEPPTGFIFSPFSKALEMLVFALEVGHEAYVF